MKKLLAVLALAVAAAGAQAAAPSTLTERKQAALQQHISDPFPLGKGRPPFEGEPAAWGEINLAFARLALHGPTNATLAAEVSAEVASWAHEPQYTPWPNYTVKRNIPLGTGLGRMSPPTAATTPTAFTSCSWHAPTTCAARAD